MKQVFDDLRKQIEEKAVMRANSNKFYDNPQDGQYVDEVVLVESMDSIINEAEAKWEAEVCEWKYNESEDFWESSCDHLHIFMADGPVENMHEFCPYCGKKIKVVE